MWKPSRVLHGLCFRVREGGRGTSFLCGVFVLKMASDGGALKDIHEIKSQFRTREGFYKLLTLSDSQQRGGLPRGPASASGTAPGAGLGATPGGASVPGPGSGASATAAAAAAASSSSAAGFLPAVRVSMVKLQPEDPSEESERVCFNIGRELYFYTYTNIKKAVDLSKPIDKRIYKGTQPTCHDFNQHSATAHSVSLIVGFSAGQVQYLDPIKKETSKLFNEERLIDKSKVTCLKWLPKSEHLFLAAHASGQLYLYNAEHPCGTAAPQYSLLRQGEGFAVYTCKAKTPRNPLLRWAVGEGALNEFAFSPDGGHLACVGQDGCLRVFHFDSMELQGVMKSYFGGLLCVSWSPDGKFLATGGEDDLVTVWSFSESRVVARGHGHKSWVNVVAFDPFTTSVEEEEEEEEEDDDDEEEDDDDGQENGEAVERSRPEPMDFSASEEELRGTGVGGGFRRVRTGSSLSRLSRRSGSGKGAASSVTYRFGSVGQDTQFCLWDLTEDVLYPRLPLSRARTLTNTFNSLGGNGSEAGALGLGHGHSHGHHHHHHSHAPTATHTHSHTHSHSHTHTHAHPHHHPPSLPRSLSRSNSLPHPAVSSSSSSSKNQSSDSTGSGVGGGSGGGVPFSIGRFATLSLQERKSDKSGGGSLIGGGGSSSSSSSSGEKEHKRYHSLGNISKSNDKINVATPRGGGSGGGGGGSGGGSSRLDAAKVLGTALCPRMTEVPLLEPLVCKKIAHERLTVLLFMDDCIITACQEGLICTWARPGKGNLTAQNGSSPSGTVV
ncbi:WD repeat-containing protein 20 [Amia ocellicauda]|uniref:WD repeat-containing protein 20 n=1 Tax=Amia ocellicauda TaxID=2972642 RepID=UPI0034649570